MAQVASQGRIDTEALSLLQDITHVGAPT